MSSLIGNDTSLCFISINSFISTAQLTAPGPFIIEIDGSCNATRWKTWHRKFETFVKAAGIKADIILPTLLNLAGDQLDEVVQGLMKAGDDYATVTAAITKTFEELKNVDKLVLIFRGAQQRQGRRALRHETTHARKRLRVREAGKRLATPTHRRRSRS